MNPAVTVRQGSYNERGGQNLYYQIIKVEPYARHTFRLPGQQGIPQELDRLLTIFHNNKDTSRSLAAAPGRLRFCFQRFVFVQNASSSSQRGWPL